MNVLGVVYLHTKTEDGGDLYFTRYAEPHQDHLDIKNWYEESWFAKHRVKLLGTSSVYRVPTRRVHGTSLDLVVKNCRVGEDVPINTHTLEEFVSAEFNSPWEEFTLVMEMGDKQMGQRLNWIRVQRPLAIYVPPADDAAVAERQVPCPGSTGSARATPASTSISSNSTSWCTNGSGARTSSRLFQDIKLDMQDMVYHLQTMQKKAFDDLSIKGYHMADMKPEHVIFDEEDCERIEEMGRSGQADAAQKQVEAVYHLLNGGKYSIIDYELLFRTPEHEDRVKASRRHSYLDDMRDRMEPTPLPSHLTRTEIFGCAVHLRACGKHRRPDVGRGAGTRGLFDYFLPERWRKTPSLEPIRRQ